MCDWLISQNYPRKCKMKSKLFLRLYILIDLNLKNWRKINVLIKVRRLVAENGSLREELANTQTKLCDAEQRATKAEEERAHFKVF